MATAKLASVATSDKFASEQQVHVIAFGGNRRGFEISFGEDPGNLRDQVSEIFQAARDLAHLANAGNLHAPPRGRALEGIEILLEIACALDSEEREESRS